MRFVLKSGYSREYTKITWKLRAKRIISTYVLKSNDIILNNYLSDTFNINLRALCLLLLVQSEQAFDAENNMYIYWKDPKYDKLVRLITYGTGKIPGSKILQKAFS